MNTNIFEGKWKETMGSAREQWGKITHDELLEIDGKKDKLQGMIQLRYGLSQDEATSQIDEWASKIKHTIKH